VRGWEKRDQLRNAGAVVSWINAIALNYHRCAVHDEARYQALPDLCGRVGIDLAPLDAARVLKFCHPQDRVLFEHQLDGFTMKEIASKLGVSETAIRIRLLRARRAVRASVEGRASKLLESLPLRHPAAAAKIQPNSGSRALRFVKAAGA
jgi:DNA-directed RNA polymerase specialized sigma24 family protein